MIHRTFFFQAEDGIRDYKVTGVQTCALPIYDAVAAIDDALAVLRAPEAGSAVDTEATVGDVLAGAVALARAGGVDAESALRGWAVRYREHFQRMEALARVRGVDLAALAPTEVDGLW